MSEYPDYDSLLASEAALGIFYPPPSSSGSNQQSMSTAAHPPNSAPSSGQTSLQSSSSRFVNQSVNFPSAYPSTWSPQPASGFGQPPAPSSSGRSADKIIDSTSELPSTQGPQSLSGFGRPPAPSSSSRSANETFDFPSGIPSIWSPQSVSGFGRPSALSSSSRSADKIIDLTSESPSTQGPQSVSGFRWPSAPSSSSRSANETFDFPSGIPSIWSPQAALGLAQPSAYRQSSTIGHPPTSFGQPLSIPNETSISTPRSDPSEVWDDFEDSPAAQTPLSRSPPIMTDSQPEVETVDPKQLMTTPAILSTWDPQSASELGQLSADGKSSTIERPLTSSETPPQQTVDQASTLSTSPPSYQTVTVKFLADGERPCDHVGGYYRFSFDYRTYNEISTGETVKRLVRFLRQENAKLHGVREMIGVTVMVEKGKNKYAARETLLEEGEMADKRLVELGWGEDCAEIWLIVKRPEGIKRPNETSSFVSIASMRKAEREHAGAGP